MTPPSGRLLAIDHGRKVLGLAVCDVTGLLATPLRRLLRRSRQEDFAAIASIVQEVGAQAIVVGLPLPPPGYEGYSQADTVRLWASRLAAAVDVPVRLWDETFSSEDASRLLADDGHDSRGRHDEVAAAVILQSYLDSLREGFAVPPAVAPFEGE
jgi:putative Holliday junction resolvase